MLFGHLVQPVGIPDNFGGEPVMVVVGLPYFHEAQSAKRPH